MPVRAADKLYNRVNHLFAATLKGGKDADAAWKAIRSLRKLGCQLVFDHAETWCSSPIPMKRTRAADVFAQFRRPTRSKQKLGSREYAFRQESFELVAAMFKVETDLTALHSQLMALGFLENPATVPLLVTHAAHADEDIRHAVTRALINFANDPLAVAALAKLCDDTDKDNRNWAIFALGVIGDADSEDLRQFFLAHLADPFEEARVEAIASLGKRQDPRVVPTRIKMIRNTGPGMVLLEAARDLLEMDEDLPNWYAKDYIAALEAKFPAVQSSTK